LLENDYQIYLVQGLPQRPSPMSRRQGTNICLFMNSFIHNYSGAIQANDPLIELEKSGQLSEFSNI